MSNRKKAVIATAGFTVGSIVAAALLTIAGRYGMANDLIAMIGVGVVFVSGLITIGYIWRKLATDAS